MGMTGIPPAPRGVPQIEVSFDLSANGILSVNAKDKKGSASGKITIESQKGRLSEEEINKIVSDAEKYKEEDDKKKVREKIDETVKWVDENQAAEVDEFEEKKKELEEVWRPIMMKAYQASGAAPGAGPAGPAAGPGGDGPKIDEVD